jgi:quinol monooxygenase YgiN
MDRGSKTTLNLRFKLKPGARDAMLADLRTILDHCAREEEFITTIVQETPERPDELILFELWRGTQEDFRRVQGPKAYRKEFSQRAKEHVESVEAIFSEPIAEWGTSLLEE